ncbi:MAG: radical SAM protein [Endomicrobiales bacterium]|nr:radical SAM protein [Endomicrobiales bacterium]
MRAALVICPFWDHEYPSLAVPLLSSLLKEQGHSVIKYDVNKELFDKYAGEYGRMWKGDNPLHGRDVIEKIARVFEADMESITNRILSGRPDIVGFSVFMSNINFSIEMAKRIKEKRPGVRVVVGGPESTLRGREIAKNEFVDFVLPGEADISLPVLMEKLENKSNMDDCRGVYYKKSGNVLFTGEPPAPENLDHLPIPDYTGIMGLYKNSRYSELSVQGSRGCIGRCAYCNDHLLSRRYRVRDPEKVFEEMVVLHAKHGIKQFHFTDSLINGNMTALESFCDLMIGRRMDGLEARHRNKGRDIAGNIYWGGMALVRPEMTYAILAKMRSAGCTLLNYGIESGSQKVLNKMNKRFTVPEAVRLIMDTRRAGIKCVINIMAGIPTETEKDFERTVDFINSIKGCVDKVVVSQTSCVIIEGTDLASRPEDYGITGEPHGLFWVSNRGKNNFDVRYKRYERLMEVIERNGLHEKGSVDWIKEKKSMYMGKYYRYRDEKRLYNMTRRAFIKKDSCVKDIMDKIACKYESIV